MGYDLIGRGTSVNVTTWEMLLRLGEMYGWEPTGTQLTQNEYVDAVFDWSGTYCSNDFQLVTDEDARALAAALAKAVDDVPENHAMGAKLKSIGGFEVVKHDAHFSPLEFFSGRNKKRLRELIAVFKAGGFLLG